jgi:hypothetical protein
VHNPLDHDRQNRNQHKDDGDQVNVVRDDRNFSEPESRQSHQRGPGDGADPVPEGEAANRHPRHPDYRRKEGAHDRDEPGENNCGDSVSGNERIRLKAIFRLEDSGVVPEQPRPDPGADGVPTVPAGDRRCGHDRDQDPQRKSQRRAQQRRREHQAVTGQKREQQPRLDEHHEDDDDNRPRPDLPEKRNRVQELTDAEG